MIIYKGFSGDGMSGDGKSRVLTISPKMVSLDHLQSMCSRVNALRVSAPEYLHWSTYSRNILWSSISTHGGCAASLDSEHIQFQKYISLCS